MALIVLSQNTDNNSEYSGDDIFKVYHYPKKYRNNTHEGDTFVYKSKEGYFGKGCIGKITHDEEKENYFAELLQTEEFKNIVSITLPNGEYVEQLGYESKRKRPPWQWSVRPLSDKAYQYILQAAEKKENIRKNITDTNCKKLNFETTLKSDFSKNRIIFGAPGTGKSYTLNLDKDVLIGKNNNWDYERVTFHPDYSYANFVGTYKPVPYQTDSNTEHNNKGKKDITYEYVPGPFMHMYVKALQNAQTKNPRPFLLIIEEINRANTAAVFGDVFQLLDRNENGVSEYPIQATEDVKKYLADYFGNNKYDYSEICLPNNLFIWATMNSADQGVFPMDTAFKRRWDFTYLGIDEKDDGLDEIIVTLGKGNSRHTVSWNALRKAINSFLAMEKINEDKQIGPYFIKNPIPDTSGPNNVSEAFIDVFKNKILMYLYEDAARHKREDLFDKELVTDFRYSEICNRFDEIGIMIFCTDIKDNTGYKPAPDNKVDSSTFFDGQTSNGETYNNEGHATTTNSSVTSPANKTDK